MTDLKKLVYPKEAAEQMGISVATVTRCVKRGAPVHRWGATGYRYKINVEEFVDWMEHQNAKETMEKPVNFSDVQAMAAKRRAMIAAI